MGMNGMDATRKNTTQIISIIEKNINNTPFCIFILMDLIYILRGNDGPGNLIPSVYDIMIRKGISLDI